MTQKKDAKIQSVEATQAAQGVELASAREAIAPADAQLAALRNTPEYDIQQSQ
jgi:hypothetical protein